MTLIEWYIPGISGTSKYKISLQPTSGRAAATAAKSLQLCPTLCNPIDGSPPGSPIPGILQARTLEWVAISFSNARKWKVKVKSLSCVRLCETPWTAVCQAPPSMGFSRQEYWSGLPLTSPYLYLDGLKVNVLQISSFKNMTFFCVSHHSERQHFLAICLIHKLGNESSVFFFLFLLFWQTLCTLFNLSLLNPSTFLHLHFHYLNSCPNLLWHGLLPW